MKNQKALDSGGETCKATDGSLPKRRQRHQSSVEGDREMEEAFLEREGERALLCVMASLPERTAASPTIPTYPKAREMSDKEFAQRLRCGSNTVVNSK